MALLVQGTSLCVEDWVEAGPGGESDLSKPLPRGLLLRGLRGSRGRGCCPGIALGLLLTALCAQEAANHNVMMNTRTRDGKFRRGVWLGRSQQRGQR